MKLRCPYCKTVFERLEDPVCTGCGRALRMAWESDLKNPKARAVFRVSRGKKPEPLLRPRRREAPSKPPAIMIPWLLFSYRSRIFMWTLFAATLIVGRLLFVHLDDVQLMLSDEEGHRVRCRKELTALRTGLEWFRANCKRYPTDAEGLRALVRNPGGVPGWHGYYIDQLPPDPWGHPYRYCCTNDAVRVWGTGPDGTDGTADDIASPEPDWRALMERVSVRDLPRWPSNAVPTQAISRP